MSQVLERIVTALACLVMCPVFGAVAIEFGKRGGVFDTFWAALWSLFMGVGCVVFASLALFALIGIFAAFAPDQSQPKETGHD